MRNNDKIDISAATVIVGNRLRVIVKLFRRVDFALLHFCDLAKSFLGRLFVPGKGKLVDMVLRAFFDSKRDNQRPFLAFPANFLHLDVDIAVVLVKLLHRVEVLLELDFVESS